MISFFIPCVPPKATGNNTKQIGRNRRTGKAVMFDSKNSRDVKRMITDILQPHRPVSTLEGPLKLSVVFVFPLNKADTSTKIKREAIELGGYVWHDTKPDLDNLRKILNDTMEKLGFFHNDSQIVIDHGVKVRGKKTGIRVDIDKITMPCDSGGLDIDHLMI